VKKEEKAVLKKLEKWNECYLKKIWKREQVLKRGFEGKNLESKV